MKRHALGEQYADFAQQDETLQFGMWVFLASEVLLFAGLFALYASYRAMYGADFDDGDQAQHARLRHGQHVRAAHARASPSRWRCGRRGAGATRLAVAMLVATMLLGVAFIVIKLFEYAQHFSERALPGPFYHMTALPTYGANRFFTMYWLMTGLHALHVTGGVCLLGWLTWRASHRFYTPTHHVGLEMGTLYWHLIDIIWIFLWPIMYLA